MKIREFHIQMKAFKIKNFDIYLEWIIHKKKN